MTLTQGILTGLKYVGSGLAAIGIGGAGVGLGLLFGNFLQSLSRAPEREKSLFSYAILGFALTEAMGLLSVLISFLILFS